MESEDCVTQGQGPEMTVSSLGRARFTVPRGQRLRMAKPVRAGMGERAGGSPGRWLSRDRDQRQPKWELEPVDDPECRHQPIEETGAAQPPQPEQSHVDQPAERAHRIAAADPLDGKAARLQFAPELGLGGATGMADLEDTLAQALADPIVDPAVVSVGAFHDFEGRGPGCQVHVASLQMETPPSWRGVAPVSHVKKAIIRSR